MKSNLILILITCILLTGCIGKNCPDCDPPPPAIIFDLVDKLSGENLFTNQTLDGSKIKLINAENQERLGFDMIDDNRLILFYGLWNTEIITIQVHHDSDLLFSLYIDAIEVSDGCCSYIEYQEMELINAEGNYDVRSEIYTVRL